MLAVQTLKKKADKEKNFINQASHQPHNLYNLQSVTSSAPVSSLSSTADLYKNVNSDINVDLIDETTQDGCPVNSF